MDDIRITLSLFWAALMLIYLLGDVLRIFAGDFKPGEIDGKEVAQSAWLGIAILMVMPIMMIIFTLIIDYAIIRIVNIVAAIFFFIFNVMGLKGYKPYDQFLIIVSLGINLLTVWYAWNW